MNHIRICGNPFRGSADAAQLCAFLRLASESGLRCCLAPVTGWISDRFGMPGDAADPPRPAGAWSDPAPADLALLRQAMEQDLAATALLVVFAPESQLADATRLAGLAWPRAAAVLPVRPGTPADQLVARVRAEMRWAGSEHPQHALEETALNPWRALPPARVGGPIVHVGGGLADGTDLLVAAWLDHFAIDGPALRLVLPDADDCAVDVLRRQLADRIDRVELVRAPFHPDQVRDAAVIALPWRRPGDLGVLVKALASARPVCVSRCRATARLLDGHGICLPIGGRTAADPPTTGIWFLPRSSALVAALRSVWRDPVAAAAIGQRGRRHVTAELTRGRPASPPPPVHRLAPRPPRIAIEGPLFGTAPAALWTRGIAAAIARHADVELHLLPTAPIERDLGWLRQRAPQLEQHLVRNPGAADLWITADAGQRAARPSCRRWALRVDLPYRALPVELAPHVTEIADFAIVADEAARRCLIGAGQRPGTVFVLPSGFAQIDGVAARPDARVIAFRGGRPAVLFPAAPAWEQGFDVFLGAALRARAAGHEFVVVVAPGPGQGRGEGDLHYLIARWRAAAGTPPLLVIETDADTAERAAVFAACDLMVHPLRIAAGAEAGGLALGCGLPIAVTDGAWPDDAALAGCFRIPAQVRPMSLPTPHLGQPWSLEPSVDETARLCGELLAGLPAARAAARLPTPPDVPSPWAAAASALVRLASGDAAEPAAPRPEEVLVPLPLAPRRAVPETVPG